MDPLTEYFFIIDRLPERTRSLLEAIRNPGPLMRTFRPREFITLISTILTISGDRIAVQRALILLVRLGAINPQVVTGAIELATATAGEGGAVVIAGGGVEGSSGGAAAAAGGASIGLVISVLAAMLAVAFAIYTITTELTTELELPDSGGPLGALLTPASRQLATEERMVTVRAIGTRTSLNRAIEAAQKMCDMNSGICAGNCPEGQRSKPTVAVQTTEQFYRFFFTTTVLKFTCPCVCR